MFTDTVSCSSFFSLHQCRLLHICLLPALPRPCAPPAHLRVIAVREGFGGLVTDVAAVCFIGLLAGLPGLLDA